MYENNKKEGTQQERKVGCLPGKKPLSEQKGADEKFRKKKVNNEEKENVRAKKRGKKNTTQNTDGE